jgi:polysaccharide biosynthesis transport protein
VTITNGDIESARSQPGAIPPANANMEIDIGDLYRAVARRWRLLPLALFCTMSLAGAYIVVTPARYAANMSFLVDTRERPPAGTDAQPVAQSLDAGLIESQMRLLTSNEVLRRMINDEQLRVDPEFAPAKPGVIAKLKSYLGMAAPKPEVTIDGIVESLGKSITTKRNEKSYVIDVEVKASSPEKAERIARALANAYHETQAKMGDDIADKEIEWLDKKISDLRTRLEQAEQRVQDYRKSGSILITDGHTPPEQQLKDANSALMEARGKRAELEAKYNQLQAAIRSGGSIENLNEAVRSPLIEKLRGDYAALSRDAAYAESTLGPRHPSYAIVKAQLNALRAQMKAEMQRISLAEGNELKAARATERANEQIVASLEKSINDTGDRRYRLEELERQAAAVRERYEKALAARENVHREVVSSPNGVLIDQPTAQKYKASPKTLPALLIALAAGLNIWIMSALVLEFLERKRKSQPAKEPPLRSSSKGGAGEGEAPVDKPFAPRRGAESRWAAAGEQPATVFVTIPQIKQGSPENPYDRASGAAFFSRIKAVMATPGAPYRRAMTEFCDAVWSGPVNRSVAIIAVGSSAAGAGATTICLSLALAACAQGDRVLLVDCDSNNPKLSSLAAKLPRATQRFGFKQGLFNFHKDLDGGGEILITRFDGVWPQERNFRSRFDLILLDCGPMVDDEPDLPPAEDIDAVVMIERSKTGERRACLLRKNGAGDRNLDSSQKRMSA